MVVPTESAHTLFLLLIECLSDLDTVGWMLLVDWLLLQVRKSDRALSLALQFHFLRFAGLLGNFEKLVLLLVRLVHLLIAGMGRRLLDHLLYAFVFVES